MEDKRPLQSIPDDELLHRLAELMGQSRRVEADIVAHIGEVDERRLYAREAFPSMFAYCMDVLHLSEAEAYLRISAARASRKHPILLTMLGDGRLHLTAIALLAPHLTRENRERLLERATHRSKRQIEELIAEIAPRPDVPVMVRKLPERRPLPTPGLLVVPIIGDDLGQGLGQVPMLELSPDGVGVLRPDGVGAPVTKARQDPPVSPSVVQPLSPGRYKVQFTASDEFHDKLERLRALMSSELPGCDLAAVIEQAPSQRSWNGSRPVASRGRGVLASSQVAQAGTKALWRPTRQRNARLPPRATSPRASGVPYGNATAADAATWMSKDDGARSATSSNSTMGTRTATGVSTACRTSG